ncbi:MAG: photosystem I biogenesis protein BtpA [Pseudanabaena sp.]
MDLISLFDTPKPVIGVIHLLPLPTSPRWGSSLKEVIDRAEQEATALAAGGVQGIIVENLFDAPFTKDRVDPALGSAMSLVVHRVKQMVGIPVGINVLRNDGHSAMAIASCVGAQFIRINVLMGVMATDQGIIEGDAYQLLRYRRELGTDVKIFADVLVKHAQPISVPKITAAVHDTIHRGLADAVILSGWATGNPPTTEDLKEAKLACDETPLFVGSGATWDNVPQLMQYDDGVIVSSSLKRNGQIQQAIDPIRVSRFVEAVRLDIANRKKNLAEEQILRSPTVSIG